MVKTLIPGPKIPGWTMTVQCGEPTSTIGKATDYPRRVRKGSEGPEPEEKLPCGATLELDRDSLYRKRVSFGMGDCKTVVCVQCPCGEDVEVPVGGFFHESELPTKEAWLAAHPPSEAPAPAPWATLVEPGPYDPAWTIVATCGNNEQDYGGERRPCRRTYRLSRNRLFQETGRDFGGDYCRTSFLCPHCFTVSRAGTSAFRPGELPDLETWKTAHGVVEPECSGLEAPANTAQRPY